MVLGPARGLVPAEITALVARVGPAPAGRASVVREAPESVRTAPVVAEAALANPPVSLS